MKGSVVGYDREVVELLSERLSRAPICLSVGLGKDELKMILGNSLTNLRKEGRMKGSVVGFCKGKVVSAAILEDLFGEDDTEVPDERIQKIAELYYQIREQSQLATPEVAGQITRVSFVETANRPDSVAILVATLE